MRALIELASARPLNARASSSAEPASCACAAPARAPGAAVDLAQREVEAAAKIVHPRQLRSQPETASGALGLLQHPKASSNWSVILMPAAMPSHASQRSASSSANSRALAVGVDRLGDRAEVLQHLAPRAGQLVDVAARRWPARGRARPASWRAPGGTRRSGRAPPRGRRAARQGPRRGRGARRADGIPRRTTPRRGDAAPASRLQQRRVHALPDQGVSEHVIVAIGPHQIVLDQPGAGVAGACSRRRSTSSEKRWPMIEAACSACRSSGSRLIDPRQHQALDRAGKGRRGGFLGDAQQLLQKQRVAFGALDAGHGQPGHRLEGASCQRDRFLPAQRPEVDGQQGAAPGAPRHASSIGSPSMREVMTSNAGHSGTAAVSSARYEG